MVGMKRLGTLAAGLLLALPAVTSGADTAKPVTFSKDVAPILQSKCQSCHEPGSIGPMSLITYQEARPWAKSIRARVSTRQTCPTNECCSRRSPADTRPLKLMAMAALLICRD